MGLKTNETDSRAVRNLDSTHEEHTTHLLTPETKWRKQTETDQDSGQFP